MIFSFPVVIENGSLPYRYGQRMGRRLSYFVHWCMIFKVRTDFYFFVVVQAFLSQMFLFCPCMMLVGEMVGMTCETINAFAINCEFR